MKQAAIISRRKRISQKISIKHIIKRALYLTYFLVILAFIIFHLYFADRILPNTWVNGVDISNKKSPEAIAILKEHFSESNEFTIKVKDNTRQIKSSDIEFNYLPVATVKKAFARGRSGNFYSDFKTKLLSFLNQSQVRPEYQYNESQLKSFVSLLNINLVGKFTEPKFDYENNEVVIKGGMSGESIDEQLLANDILKNFINGGQKEVSAKVSIVNPTLKETDLYQIKARVEKIMVEDYFLSFEDKNWPISKVEAASFLKPTKKGIIVDLEVDRSAVLSKLNAIAKEIDRNPKSQHLEVKDHRVVRFDAPINGQRLKIKDSYENIEKDLLAANAKILLVVEVTSPPQVDNEYQITDVLGVGKSKFKGSDAGRMHNIETAVNKINGVLVAPGETYSFVDEVGPIDRAHGFSQAKVISGGRTVLGDGGGVCQVSTTVFRAALNSGLQILERNAHAYRVGYYEQDSPPGIDATIFSPSVDFQFKNDTSGYILVSAELDKANYALSFTIYGKKDGRTVDVTEPKVTNRIAAPATRYLDDPNLPKGQRRQLEYSVQGATVEFNRVVKKGDSVLYNDVFKSRYRAWGAIFAVGTKE